MSVALQDFEAPTKDPIVGTVLAGRYRIVRRIGGGGMGTVYEAEHVMIGRRVAVKMLHAAVAADADVVRRFMNEARAAAMLTHKNILECTDVGQHEDGAPFLVLGLLHGTSLADAIEGGGPMAIGRAVRIAQQVCAGLAAAHAKGIVHRDMKPDNVFLENTEDPSDISVKIFDFGISKFTQDLGSGTKTGSMLGTPYYMSPEQLSDSSTVDARTDVYAVGAILFECLTGHAPFEAESLPALVVKIAQQDAPRLSTLRGDVPPELDELVASTLAKSAEARPPSVQSLAAQLAPFGGVEVPVALGATLVSYGGPRPIGGTLANSGVRERESVASSPPRPSRAALIGGLGVAVFAVLGLGALALRFAMPPAQAVDVPVRMPTLPALPATASSAVTVRLRVSSPQPGATVTLRGVTHALPFDGEVPAADVHEMVSVSAPGHVTRRYGLLLSAPRSLHVVLDPGHGDSLASDAQLAAALSGADPSTPVRLEPAAPARGSTNALVLDPPPASGAGSTASAPANPPADSVASPAAAPVGTTPTPPGPAAASPAPNGPSRPDPEESERPVRGRRRCDGEIVNGVCMSL